MFGYSKPADAASDSERPDQRLSSTVLALSNYDEDKVIRFLVSDRVYGFPNTDGSICSNYVSYVNNNHPLLAMCLSFRCHPFTKKKRLIVFICSLAFAICISYILLCTHYIYILTVCREGCSSGAPSTSNSTMSHAPTTIHAKNQSASTDSVCVGGFNNGMTTETYNSHCAYYQPWMISAAGGIAIVIYGSAMKFLATCGCLHGRAFFALTCLGSCIKGIIMKCGGTMLSFFIVLSLGMVLYPVIDTAIQQKPYDFFVTVLYSKLFSLGYWFIWTLPYFLIRYPFDKRRFNREHNRVDAGSSDDRNVQLTMI